MELFEPYTVIRLPSDANYDFRGLALSLEGDESQHYPEQTSGRLRVMRTGIASVYL